MWRFSEVGTGYAVVVRLALAGATLASPFSAKLRDGLRGRHGLKQRLIDQCRSFSVAPIWFHVASSGELEQCLPIVDRIKSIRPSQTIFLSYFSPTARRALSLERERRASRGLTPPWDGADFSPFDLRKHVNAYLDVLRPKCLVMIHRELWPELIEACTRRGIPCHLFAAYFPSASSRSLWLYGRSLRRLTSIGTTDDGTTALLKSAWPDIRAETVGDPRVDRVMMRKSLATSAPWQDLLRSRSNFVAASIWPKDFEYLKLAFKALSEEHPDWRMVLVPHEPTSGFVRELLTWVRGLNARCQPWSEWIKKPTTDCHIVVDAVGFLAELYRIATIVYVGGSAVARVHNVLEPAAYACPILTGPFIENSPQAVAMSVSSGGLVRTSEPDELKRRLLELVNNRASLSEKSESLTRYIQSQQGAPARYADWLVRE